MIGYGEKIRTYRVKHNLTQNELAEMLGIATSSVAMYENEEREPRREIKLKLSKLIGETVESLFF